MGFWGRGKLPPFNPLRPRPQLFLTVTTQPPCFSQVPESSRSCRFRPRGRDVGPMSQAVRIATSSIRCSLRTPGLVSPFLGQNPKIPTTIFYRHLIVCLSILRRKGVISSLQFSLTKRFLIAQSRLNNTAPADKRRQEYTQQSDEGRHFNMPFKLDAKPLCYRNLSEDSQASYVSQKPFLAKQGNSQHEDGRTPC